MPRIISILFAAFVSIFALDAFSEPGGNLERLGAVVMHLIPALVVAGAVAIAWRWERFGALFFSALAIVYLVITQARFPLATRIHSLMTRRASSRVVNQFSLRHSSRNRPLKLST